MIITLTKVITLPPPSSEAIPLRHARDGADPRGGFPRRGVRGAVPPHASAEEGRGARRSAVPPGHLRSGQLGVTSDQPWLPRVVIVVLVNSCLLLIILRRRV